jgi:hypothetical protein
MNHECQCNVHNSWRDFYIHWTARTFKNDANISRKKMMPIFPLLLLTSNNFWRAILYICLAMYFLCRTFGHRKVGVGRNFWYTILMYMPRCLAWSASWIRLGTVWLETREICLVTGESCLPLFSPNQMLRDGCPSRVGTRG